jgi:hypothetical protein
MFGHGESLLLRPKLHHLPTGVDSQPPCKTPGSPIALPIPPSFHSALQTCDTSVILTLDDGRTQALWSVSASRRSKEPVVALDAAFIDMLDQTHGSYFPENLRTHGLWGSGLAYPFVANPVKISGRTMVTA